MKLKKITPYTRNKVRKNLRNYFDLATERHLYNGKAWYSEAHEIVKSKSERSNGQFDVYTVAGVLSALSPRNKWERNVFDTGQVLEAVQENTSPEDVKVCTFNTNKYKAFAIAQGKVGVNKSSRKTHAFIQNIATLNEDYVTIDVWVLRAMFGKTVVSGLTPSRYDELSSILLDEARKVGLKGYEYQAIIWECIRERY